MKASVYRHLEILWIDLEPIRNLEKQKKRSCVILQSDLVNKGSRTVIVAPILPKYKNWPFVVNVTPTKTNGLKKDHHINLKQLRAVDASRIKDRRGNLEKNYLEHINKTIKIVFNL